MQPQPQDSMFPAVDEPVTIPAADPQPAADEENPMSAREQQQLAKDLLEQALDETIKRQQQEILSSQNRFEMQQRLARLFAKSGYFADLKGGGEQEQIAKAMVKIQLGEAAGLSPMESMQSVYMVNGRPTIASEVRAARMKRSGYDWDIVRLDDQGCTLLPKYRGQYFMTPKRDAKGALVTKEDGSPVLVPAEVSFDEKDATKAGLITKTGSVFKTFPRNMYFARAITNMQRWYAPEVLNGTHLLDRVEAEELGSDEPKRPALKRREEDAA